MKNKVFVMLSGGVDSSVAALLLKKSGKYDVQGAHLICWRDACSQTQKEAIYAMLVAKKLGIPFHLFDLEKEYKEKVFNYMISEYAGGKTPNPDVMCNKEIKFGMFLEKALEMGVNYVATGHYVKKLKVKSEKLKVIYKLFEAKDKNKDQSYFLWTLNQKQLKHCIFPIGDYTKEEARRIAKENNLATAEKKDSQGLCFVGKMDFAEFVSDYIAESPGKVFNESGKEIGIHSGVQFYTIGQRRGIGLANGSAQYVARKNIKTNTLILAESRTNPLLYQKEIAIENLNWISGELPKLPFRCEARIRYRGDLSPCSILRTSDVLRVKFSFPQWAVASGQSIVFYKNKEMLGGGVIK